MESTSAPVIPEEYHENATVAMREVLDGLREYVETCGRAVGKRKKLARRAHQTEPVSERMAGAQHHTSLLAVARHNVQRQSDP